jgi:hypothetical protein
MAIQVVSLALRGFQVLFAVIVIGVTADLIKGQVFGSAPASFGFTTFAGSVALIGAAVGIAANWIESLNGAITWGVDTFTAIVNLAAGVVSLVG